MSGCGGVRVEEEEEEEEGVVVGLEKKAERRDGDERRYDSA